MTITAREITLNVDSINKTYDGAYSALTRDPAGRRGRQRYADAATILANVTFASVNGTPIANAFVNAGTVEGVTVSSTCDPTTSITPAEHHGADYAPALGDR